MPAQVIWTEMGKEVGGGIACFFFVLNLFKIADDLATPEDKKRVGIWLIGVEWISKSTVEKARSVADMFAHVFDRVFGEKHWSFTCFFRSLIASTMSFWLCLFLSILAQPTGIHGHYTWSLAWINFAVAVIPDYLSLLKSRFLIKLMSRAKSLWLLLVCVVADAVVSLWIAVLIFDLYNLAFMLRGPSRAYAWQVAGSMFASSFRGPLYAIGSIALFRYLFHQGLFTFGLPALFTSIWLWLYAASGLILTLVRRFHIASKWMNDHLNIKDKPILALGVPAGVVAAAAFWLKGILLI